MKKARQKLESQDREIMSDVEADLELLEKVGRKTHRRRLPEEEEEEKEEEEEGGDYNDPEIAKI
jgi:hypothetical protein